MRNLWPVFVLLLQLLPAALPTASAQTLEPDEQFCPIPILCPPPDGPPIHYAYAIRFGTGSYTIADQQAYVLRITPGSQLRPFAYPPARKLGIQLRVPFSLGYTKFDDSDIIGSFGDVTTLSVMPGVRFQLPMSRDWQLRPYGHVGYANQLDGDDDAWLWRAGLGSYLAFGEKRLIYMYNGLDFFGFDAEHDEDDQVWDLTNGVELLFPIKLKIRDHPSVIRTHLALHYYFDELKFRQLNRKRRNLEWEVELGVAFGPQTIVRVMGPFRFNRFGIAFRTSNDNILQGVKLYMSTPFE